MSYTDKAEEIARQQQIAQERYQNWLISQGIVDPEARIQPHIELGYIGIPSDSRKQYSGVVYDVLPEELLIAINREIARLPQNYSGLAARLRVSVSGLARKLLH